MVGTAFSYQNSNDYNRLIIIKNIPPGTEIDEDNNNEIIKSASFGELVDYYEAIFMEDYEFYQEFINTDAVQGTFFYTNSSIEGYGQYYFLITDPTFNKEVFVGWVYFPKEEPEESCKQAMREFLKNISYSAASRVAL